MNKKNIYLYSFLALIGSVLAIYFAALFDSVLLKQKLESMNIFYIIKYVASSNNAWKLFLILLVAIILFVFVTAMQDSKDYQSKQIFVTPDISTPAVAGQGQCGTAKWLPPEKFDTSFDNFILDQNNPTLKKIEINSLNDIKLELERITALEEEIDQLTKEQEQEEDDTRIDELEALIDIKQHELTDEDKIIYDVTNPAVYDDIKKEIKRGALNDINPQKGGIVLGKKDLKEKEVINSLFKLVSGVPFSQERIYYILKDVHTLVLGATRSGKGRTVVLQTIGTLLLAGESIIVTDPKAESYFYYKKILELLGYKTITIDFKNPRKSTRFNFLQPIIDRVDEDDIPGAIDATWDLVSQLVGEPKGERLWNDGEASTIAACAMSVVYDNRSPENHKYRNLTNVYYFLSQMCTPIQVGKELVLPISKYVQDLPYEHPSKGLLAVADIAPSRTRGSFYTSALMTLKLFTNPLIADMTSSTDYDPMKVGDRKTATSAKAASGTSVTGASGTQYTLDHQYVKQLNINTGNITITDTGYTQTNGTSESWDANEDAYVIKGQGTSTNTITINNTNYVPTIYLLETEWAGNIAISNSKGCNIVIVGSVKNTNGYGLTMSGNTSTSSPIALSVIGLNRETSKLSVSKNVLGRVSGGYATYAKSFLMKDLELSCTSIATGTYFNENVTIEDCTITSSVTTYGNYSFNTNSATIFSISNLTANFLAIERTSSSIYNTDLVSISSSNIDRLILTSSFRYGCKITNTTINTITADLSEANALNTSLNSQLNTANTLLISLQHQIDVLMGQLNDKDAQIAELLALIAEKDTEIAGKNTQISNLQIQVQTLQETINNLSGGNDTITKLTEQINELKNQLEAKNTEISNLQKKIEELQNAGGSQSEINKLTVELNKAKDIISDLQNQIDELKKNPITVYVPVPADNNGVSDEVADTTIPETIVKEVNPDKVDSVVKDPVISDGNATVEAREGWEISTSLAKDAVWSGSLLPVTENYTGLYTFFDNGLSVDAAVKGAALTVGYNGISNAGLTDTKDGFMKYTFYARRVIDKNNIYVCSVDIEKEEYTTPVTNITSSILKEPRNYTPENSYNVLADKAITFKLSADYGTYGKGAIKYQLVPESMDFDPDGTWINVKGNSFTIPKQDNNFRIYVKFIDKNGNYTVDKTIGFKIPEEKVTQVTKDDTSPIFTMYKTIYLGYDYQVQLANVTGDVTYKSSDANIAKVNKNGLITSVKEGKAIITCSVKGKRSYIYRIVVTIADGKGSPTLNLFTPPIQATGDSPVLIMYKQLKVGTSTKLSISGIDKDATVTYINMDSDIAVVSKDGTITGITKGSTDVMAIVSKGDINYIYYIKIRVDDGTKDTNMWTSIVGTPQGGNISPLIANIMLNELDKEMDSRGLDFVRYADDCIIMVGSELAASRVMKSISKFIEEKLGLKVNVSKSKVDKPKGIKYLGFGFYYDTFAKQYKAKPHASSVAKFKAKMKKYTCRSWGVNNKHKIEKLNQLIRGWINYFKIGSMKKLCKNYDGTIRYRLRMCIWKHWKTPKNRAKNLIKLGVPKWAARRTSYAKGFARVCRSSDISQAINNERLAQFGLISMLDYYIERCVTC